MCEVLQSAMGARRLDKSTEPPKMFVDEGLAPGAAGIAQLVLELSKCPAVG